MQGFYITGPKGSYIELEDGRWADTVSESDGENRNVNELLDELTEQGDYPTLCGLSENELRAYVGLADKVRQFTGSSARIGISLPADMLEYLLGRKRQDGIPVSTQIQRAIENDILERALEHAAHTDPITDEEFEAKWAEFLRRPLVDPGVDYEAGGE